MKKAFCRTVPAPLGQLLATKLFIVQLGLHLAGSQNQGSHIELLYCQTPDQTKIKIRSNQKSGEAL